jgi:hypothetical protein
LVVGYGVSSDCGGTNSSSSFLFSGGGGGSDRFVVGISSSLAVARRLGCWMWLFPPLVAAGATLLLLSQVVAGTATVWLLAVCCLAVARRQGGLVVGFGVVSSGCGRSNSSSSFSGGGRDGDSLVVGRFFLFGCDCGTTAGQSSCWVWRFCWQSHRSNFLIVSFFLFLFFLLPGNVGLGCSMFLLFRLRLRRDKLIVGSVVFPASDGRLRGGSVVHLWWCSMECYRYVTLVHYFMFLFYTSSNQVLSYSLLFVGI